MAGDLEVYIDNEISFLRDIIGNRLNGHSQDIKLRNKKSGDQV